MNPEMASLSVTLTRMNFWGRGECELKAMHRWWRKESALGGSLAARYLHLMELEECWGYLSSKSNTYMQEGQSVASSLF
jgi:hypothetical protein